MSSKKPVRDVTSEMRAAGKVLAAPSDGILSEMQHVKTSDTPRHVQPFRKSFYARVGQAGRHYGLRNDQPPPDLRFGRRNEYESSTEACLNPAKGDKLNAISAENAEKNYLSSKREPLGKSAVLGLDVPDKLKREGFGIASKSSESAKVIIYSASGDADEAPLLHPPGEQKHRKYDWAKVRIDPTKFRFGCTTRGDTITMKELFIPPESTQILPKIVADVRSIQQPQLSKVKNLGFGNRSQSAEFCYGKSLKRDEMGARGLLSGGGAAVDLEDQTLGRPVCKSTLLKKLRAKDGSADPDHAFGCPTVRFDLPRPKNRKATNGTNYGDDVGAGSLLYPTAYTGMGIGEETFLAPMSFDAIKALSEKCNFGLTDEQVHTAFNLAAKGSADGKISAEAFKTAVDKLGY